MISSVDIFVDPVCENKSFKAPMVSLRSFDDEGICLDTITTSMNVGEELSIDIPLKLEDYFTINDLKQWYGNNVDSSKVAWLVDKDYYITLNSFSHYCGYGLPTLEHDSVSSNFTHLNDTHGIDDNHGMLTFSPNSSK